MATKELVAASSRPLVLSILERGESYGYAIIQDVKARSGGELQWTDGMLYPVLHRLEREGLIKSRWGTADESSAPGKPGMPRTPKAKSSGGGGGRKRKYYQLSREGGKALKAEKAQWLNVHNTLAQLWGVKPCPTM